MAEIYLMPTQRRTLEQAASRPTGSVRPTPYRGMLGETVVADLQGMGLATTGEHPRLTSAGREAVGMTPNARDLTAAERRVLSRLCTGSDSRDSLFRVLHASMAVQDHLVRRRLVREMGPASAFLEITPAGRAALGMKPNRRRRYRRNQPTIVFTRQGFSVKWLLVALGAAAAIYWWTHRVPTTPVAGTSAPGVL